MIYFGSTWSSGSTTPNGSILKVSNVYNCNIMDLNCIDTYQLFAAFILVFLRPLAC